MSLDRSKWPRSLHWHGWLLGLCGIRDGDPWAASFHDLASTQLKTVLGCLPVDFAGSWTPPEYWDADGIAFEMSDHPNVGTDGRREDFSAAAGFEVAGAGVYLPASVLTFDGSVWGTAEGYGDAFMPVPGVMQTVQRAEFWGAIIAMQAYWPCHLTLMLLGTLVAA